MHTDDHILESFLASNKPLAAIASDLSITLIALVHWMDKNVDLLAMAKRALETHIAFLALKAEAAALVDLTNVSSSTTNEERKRKSASQLLRHSAKRLLSNVGVPPSPRSDGEKVPSTEGARGMRGSASASSTNPERDSPPSPRPVGGGEKVPSTEGARGMRGGAITPSASAASLPSLVASGVPPVPTPSTTNPTRKREAPFASASPTDLLNQLASSNTASTNPSASPLAASFSDHEIDLMMASLANHFNIDLATLADPATDATPRSG